MNKRYLMVFIGIALIGGLLLNTGNGQMAPELEKRGENLIRFHVLANSDAPEDQELKLKVRDKIIATMGEALENSSSVEETRDILIDNLFKIEEEGEREIIANGKDYKVTAELGEDIFPTKRYGDFVFPAGKYEALKVVIGEGEEKSVSSTMVTFVPEEGENGE